MILFWLLCVSLVLVGTALRRPLGAALEHLRLVVFGVRVRCPRPQTRGRPHSGASPGPAARSGPGLPPGFATRAGP
jgi:hypothetical protein